MSRYSFYIDGFNVYYSLNNIKFCKYKWLNYRAYAESFLNPNDSIADIFYFTTYVTWKPDSWNRHKQYIKALRAEGVKEVLGRFTKKRATCHICHGQYKTREEKQTDVNIALYAVADAVNDRYDRAVIISGDTDLLPVIEMIHKLAPDKEVGVVFPPRRFNNTLKASSDFSRNMGEAILKASQFPDKVVVGGMTIERPATWQ